MMRTAKTLEILSYGRKPLKPLLESAEHALQTLPQRYKMRWQNVRQLIEIQVILNDIHNSSNPPRL